MPGSRSRFAATAILATVVAFATGSVAAVDFSHEVVPILRAKCGKCHTGSQRQGGFSLNDREAILAGLLRMSDGDLDAWRGDDPRAQAARRLRQEGLDVGCDLAVLEDDVRAAADRVEGRVRRVTRSGKVAWSLASPTPRVVENALPDPRVTEPPPR